MPREKERLRVLIVGAHQVQQSMAKWSGRTHAVAGRAHAGVQMHRGEQAEVTMILWKAECKHEVLLVCMTVSES